MSFNEDLNFSSLLVEKENVLSEALCERIIEKFRGDDRRDRGVTAAGETSIKKSVDLNLSLYEDWKDIDTQIYTLLTPHVKEYAEKISFIFPGITSSGGLDDSGYQIQETRVGEGYGWHHDAFLTTYPAGRLENTRGVPYYVGKERLFTYIFYLNDVDQGGRTQFKWHEDIISIIPRTGKLLLFPASPYYCHQGEELEGGIKYLMTGWLSRWNMVSAGIEDPATLEKGFELITGDDPSFSYRMAPSSE